jgi:hypothetical protein
VHAICCPWKADIPLEADGQDDYRRFSNDLIAEGWIARFQMLDEAGYIRGMIHVIPALEQRLSRTMVMMAARPWQDEAECRFSG